MAEASKIELGFEGGGVLRCDVGEAAFEELAAAFSAPGRGPYELLVDGAPG